MNLKTLIQTTLDAALIKDGILSFHQRKKKINAVATNQKQDENYYIVYRIFQSTKKYGDGKPILNKKGIDINLYYNDEKVTPEQLDEVIKKIKKAFLTNNFRLINDWTDLYDSDTPYSGVNLEFRYVGIENDL